MDSVSLGHGSGGRLMHELISGHFAPAFGIDGLLDSAVLEDTGGGRLALTTDSYVVSPIFFPGGDIGELAVNGTVNDLSVAGARPLYLTAAFIIEEGFPMQDLKRVVSSMSAAAKNAGVSIVAGDTKVVERGKGDGIFINTAGVGVMHEKASLSPSRMETGDRIIISGPVGSHGIAVMAERHGLSFDPPVLSDTRPLNGLTGALIEEFGDALKMMRDPTRGGLATTLKEFALDSGLSMKVNEADIPVEPGVTGACGILGLDPLYVANEGSLVAVVRPDVSKYIVEAMRAHEDGAAPSACIIGETDGSAPGTALLRTRHGGTRLIEMLHGGQLPRIC